MTAEKRLTAADYERLLRRPDADKKPSKATHELGPVRQRRRYSMKTTALTLIAGGVLAAAAAFGASGHAHAENCTPHSFTPACDQQYYLADLRNDGVVPDSQATQTALIQLGYATCNARERGMTDSQIVASITGASISPDDAEWIVIDAGMNLC